MTIDELLQVYRRYHDKVGCAGDECYVCAAQEAYEQAKKPVMGEVCPSGSRIGSTEAEVQSHAGSNPATSPANTALVQKLVDALGFYADTNNWKVEVTVDGCGCCTTARSVIKTDMGKIANAALTEATAYLKQQEGKASEVVENALEIYEFAYEKYGEHVVALRNSPQGGGVQLFNTVKLFAKNNSLAEYERVKDEAATFAKKFVAQFNAPTQQPAQHGKRAEGEVVEQPNPMKDMILSIAKGQAEREVIVPLITGEQIMALHKRWMDAGCPQSVALEEK